MRNKAAEFDKDMDGIFERFSMEGVPLKKFRLRERGRAAEEIRADIRERAMLIGVDVDRMSLRREISELLGNLEKQYHDQVFDLARTGQVNEDIPSWEDINGKITPEIIMQSFRMAKIGGEPFGLLVPDNTRYDKAGVIDRYPICPDQAYINFIKEDYNNLWNGGRDWPQKGEWEFLIVDGSPEVKYDRTIKGSNFQRAKAWVEKYAKEGLDVLTGADPYLSLVRQNLLRGVPMDQKTFTVLNAKNLQPGEDLSSGDWVSGEINLATYPPDCKFTILRLRSCIKVI